MKEIELTQGFKALVDDCDYDLVSQYEWHADMKSGYPYAMTNIYLPNGKRTRISMHRLIMGCSYGDGKIVDHKNRDTTNNTRENLRICTHSQNCTNAIGKGSSCGYKGVCYLPKRNQYYVDINNKGKRKYIGIYSNAEDAAYAYNEAAKKYYGEFAWLNPLPEGYKKSSDALTIKNMYGFHGVSWVHPDKCFRASFRMGGKMITVGRYDNAVDAGRAYNLKVAQYRNDGTMNDLSDIDFTWDAIIEELERELPNISEEADELYKALENA